MNLSSRALSFRLLENVDALAGMASDWRELLTSSSGPEPMLDLDWLLTWWDHYGQNRRVAVGLFFDGRQLVGIAPMCRRIHYYRSLVPFRRLEFMGSNGNDADGLWSHYLNLIAARGREREVALAFTERLRECAFGVWDECVLESMNSEGVLCEELEVALSNNEFRIGRKVVNRAPYIELPLSWETFLLSRGSSRRREIRRCIRDFAAWAGSRGFSVERASDRNSLRRGLEVLTALHNERWEAESQPGLFASKRFKEFHGSFAAILLERGKLDLVWLVVGNEPVAVQYSFIEGRKLYLYLCGRKMNLPRKIRIGVAMVILLINDAIKRGFREVEFLGHITEFKMMFTSKKRVLVEWRIARPTVRDTLLTGARNAESIIKNRMPRDSIP
jgi:CelD/BcsL family acetyltransferase involved in cellulose biosynthesis